MKSKMSQAELSAANQVRQVQLEYLVTNHGVRVRQASWAGDMFNVMTRTEFDIFHRWCLSLSIPIREIEESD